MDVQELAVRVEKLERENRRLKLCSGAVVSLLLGVASASACTSAVSEPRVESTSFKYGFGVSVIAGSEMVAELARQAGGVEVSVQRVRAAVNPYVEHDFDIVDAQFDTPDAGAAFCASVQSGEWQLEHECRQQGTYFKSTIANPSSSEVAIRAYCRERGQDGLIERETPLFRADDQVADGLTWRIRSGHRQTIVGWADECALENVEFETGFARQDQVRDSQRYQVVTTREWGSDDRLLVYVLDTLTGDIHEAVTRPAVQLGAARFKRIAEMPRAKPVFEMMPTAVELEE